MDGWDLEPSSEQIDAYKLPHGLRSGNECHQLALKDNLVKCLDDMDEETMSDEMKSLKAVLWHVLNSFV